ncbi:hypothetical protein T484DRAFT_3649195 [Baffinella frigidus]|nr:hypothetical protein T484DRAFT_3649195 [Cryptophyta sp. CCMP2293]
MPMGTGMEHPYAYSGMPGATTQNVSVVDFKPNVVADHYAQQLQQQYQMNAAAMTASTVPSMGLVGHDGLYQPAVNASSSYTAPGSYDHPGYANAPNSVNQRVGVNERVGASYNERVGASYNERVGASYNERVGASYNDSYYRPYNTPGGSKIDVGRNFRPPGYPGESRGGALRNDHINANMSVCGVRPYAPNRTNSCVHTPRSLYTGAPVNPYASVPMRSYKGPGNAQMAPDTAQRRIIRTAVHEVLDKYERNTGHNGHR